MIDLKKEDLEKFSLIKEELDVLIEEYYDDIINYKDYDWRYYSGWEISGENNKIIIAETYIDYNNSYESDNIEVGFDKIIEFAKTNFRKYYKLPLHIDDFCESYIWTDDNEMAFNYLDTNKINLGDLKEINNIIDKINNGNNISFNAEINKEDNTVININGIPKIMIRGWGNLTAPSCHNLSIEDATKVQNNFIDWIIKRLNE